VGETVSLVDIQSRLQHKPFSKLLAALWQLKPGSSSFNPLIVRVWPAGSKLLQARCQQRSRALLALLGDMMATGDASVPVKASIATTSILLEVMMDCVTEGEHRAKVLR